MAVFNMVGGGTDYYKDIDNSINHNWWDGVMNFNSHSQSNGFTGNIWYKITELQKVGSLYQRNLLIYGWAGNTFNYSGTLDVPSAISNVFKVQYMYYNENVKYWIGANPRYGSESASNSSVSAYLYRSSDGSMTGNVTFTSYKQQAQIFAIIPLWG